MQVLTAAQARDLLKSGAQVRKIIANIDASLRAHALATWPSDYRYKIYLDSLVTLDVVEIVRTFYVAAGWSVQKVREAGGDSVLLTFENPTKAS